MNVRSSYYPPNYLGADVHQDQAPVPEVDDELAQRVADMVADRVAAKLAEGVFHIDPEAAAILASNVGVSSWYGRQYLGPGGANTLCLQYRITAEGHIDLAFELADVAFWRGTLRP